MEERNNSLLLELDFAYINQLFTICLFLQSLNIEAAFPRLFFEMLQRLKAFITILTIRNSR